MVLNVHRRRDKKRAHTYRCFLNGAEVTRRCFYADGRRGVVRLYVHRDGKPYIDRATHEVVKEERRGHVVMIRIRKKAA